jgi:leucyl/phenylalanyl-tRNA--protein transferase
MDLLWWSPEPRAILPVDPVLVSRRFARVLRRGRFRVSLNRAFGDVIRGCQVREEGTWITPAMLDSYEEMHSLGWAHSIEVWTEDGTLAGGLYGVAVGGLFGAESMFHRVTDASKVALVALRQHAFALGTRLLDVQMQTDHLASMGAVTVLRRQYLSRVAEAVKLPVTFGAP